jgi:hypothetical protein
MTCIRTYTLLFVCESKIRSLCFHSHPRHTYTVTFDFFLSHPRPIVYPRLDWVLTYGCMPPLRGSPIVLSLYLVCLLPFPFFAFLIFFLPPSRVLLFFS